MTVPTLFVKCRACGFDFPTGLGESETSPKGLIISSLRLRCPKCRKEEAYTTKDFHIPAGQPDVVQEQKDAGSVPDPARDHAAKKRISRRDGAAYNLVPPEERSTHEG